MKCKLSFVLIISMALVLCSCVLKGTASTWQEQYDLGVRYLSEGNYEEAIIAFTAAIEIDPNQALAYIGRGNAYVLSGDTETNLAMAQTDFETAIKLDATLSEAYLGLADIFIYQNNYEKALDILAQGLEETGRNQVIIDKIAQIDQPEQSVESIYFNRPLAKIK